MKKIIVIAILCCLGSLLQAQIKKSDLKVLYVGGSSDLETVVTKQEPAILQKSIEERMAAFKNMLESYFKTVEVIDARDYLPAMSDRYDVTVFDGKPRELEPAKVERDARGRLISKTAARYLPDDFDRPAVLLAEMGETLGRRIGVKADWYCLCLDADAHSFRSGHPIFHKPFAVKMTLETKPTPEDAFHYTYYHDGPLPETLPMWKVQTKGYKTDKTFRIGMVSRPWGFEDSPDAEYISSGVCAKTLDAVAIGRHGNFLHWGFSASPKYMTEEAKAVFANAVVYIARFAGQTPIARKYNDWLATREYLKEKKYLCTRSSWEERLESDREWAENRLEIQKRAKEKQAKGEELDEDEKMCLNFQPQPSISYEDYLKRYQDEDMFEKFGTDEKAYIAYYEENRDYFYGGEGAYRLVVDEDVKSLGIPNNELALLDKVITMWEKEEDVEKARRILTRYTLCRFETAAEWRAWFKVNRSRLFFTEAGGWLFMVDTRDKGVAGNDYSIRDKAAVTPQATTSALPETEVTDDRNPVQVAVAVCPVAADKQEVVVRIKIHPGYHIYAHVAENDPFMPTTLEVKLPQGYYPVGDLKCPSSRSLGTNGTMIYEDEILFRQEISGSGSGEVVCIISYQCCDSHICMSPVYRGYNELYLKGQRRECERRAYKYKGFERV